MALSNKLISQFVRLTQKEAEPKKEAVAYGTVVKQGGVDFVRFDGAELLTPVSSTASVNEGERVTVLIKNHAATITGNLTSPAARTDDVKEIGNKIADFEIVIADKVSTKEFDTEKGRINELLSDNVLVKEKLTTAEADIGALETDKVTVHGKLTANSADIALLSTNKLDANIADIKYATIGSLDVTDAKIHNLQADYGAFKDLSTGKLKANTADIGTLKANKLDATEADLKYANIDFTNISKATMEYFYANSGLIKNVVIGSGTITGNLIGVTIKGDLIEGGTVVADKLVIKGTDGLYYKLNTNGITTEAQQTEYNSLNGAVIAAKSITATKIDVLDLVAFGATIGGFHIADHSLYSGVKNAVENTTKGIYLDDDGQFAVGDSENFLKYYKEANGSYKLAISAKSIILSSGHKDVESAINGIPTKSMEQFYQSVSATLLSGGVWADTSPIWVDGKYVWRRTVVTYGDGRTEYLPSEQGICITGNTGATGNGVVSTTIDYCLSTSKTIAPASGWQTAGPPWEPGKYRWTRTAIVYTNAPTYTAYACDSSWEAVNGAQDAITSRGEQLVTNGTGMLGNNTNFSPFTFDGKETNNSGGSFTAPTSVTGTIATDGFFPIDVNLKYRLDFDAKTKNGLSAIYSMIMFYDVDKNVIGSHHNMYIANTLTELTQDLNNGDTIIHFKDLTNWKENTGTDSWQRGFIFWDYENSRGYTYPPLSYSRNVRSDCYVDSDVNKVDKTIRLSSPWQYGVHKAGTRLSQSNAGGSYLYIHANVTIPPKWTHYAGTISGVDYSGENKSMFPPGTAFGKAGWIWNSNKANDQTWITNISVCEDVKTDIDNIGDKVNNLTPRLESCETTIEQNDKNIRMEVAGKYVAGTDFEEYKKAAMKMTDDQMEIKFNTVSDMVTVLEQNVSTQQKTTEEYIRFKGALMELGKTGNAFSMQLSTEAMTFLQNGTQIAYMSNKKLYITDVEIASSLRMGNFAFVVRSNGHLTLKFLGKGAN